MEDGAEELPLPGDQGVAVQGAVALAPSGLGHAFYGSDGASAVEIALKMSFHVWRNAGRSGKQEFVCLKNSYHGETIGALVRGIGGPVNILAVANTPSIPDLQALGVARVSLGSGPMRASSGSSTTGVVRSLPDRSRIRPTGLSPRWPGSCRV